TSTSSIRTACSAARRCSTVWTSTVPTPIAVRRSVALTSPTLAAMYGDPSTSVRTKRIPVPGAAGPIDTIVSAPVCSPLPESEAVEASVRLDIVLPVGQGLEGVNVRCKPVQGRLGPQELPVGPGWIPGDRRTGRDR